MEHCSLENAERIANELLSGIGEYRFAWEGQSFAIGASIGLVPVVGDGQELSDVLKIADAACYAAKDAGRNRLHTYRPDDQALARQRGEMQWVARLTSALSAGRFHLYAQPIFSVHDEASANECYELLLRMEDEQGELILPGTFLPAAERFGLARQLDQWVVSAGLEWLSRHPQLLARADFLSINLSGQSLGHEEFARFLIGELQQNRIAASKLCFEITETAVISNLDSARRFLLSLQQLGCRLALDDFGSGLSSFAYLKTPPVNFVKIDSQFIKDIIDDPIDKAMVRPINEIAHVMGIRTIAEFVEHKEILAILREIGVDMAQGSALGRPAPIDDLVNRSISTA